MQFEVFHTDGRARHGKLTFDRGEVRTPAFMPVGTYGTVKAMTPEDVRETGADILLGNTFHLMLRPGTEVIEAHGDLHDFMQWERPILTDSGGVPGVEPCRTAQDHGAGRDFCLAGERIKGVHGTRGIHGRAESTRLGHRDDL